ncbi:HAD family hydrolase [Mycetohabitans sp. B46]|uniref:HAD family hydrolase n=1 Tax=Mycetohabitans sp. B46 TaxID=2772536 RepID=UPI00307D3896
MTHATDLVPTRIEHIVLDWNGTLIDDIDLAVRAVNCCGERFGVTPVTRDRYRALFDFPIAGFYQALGFDFARTPFATIVEHYLECFDANVAQCALHDGVLDLLDTARAAGVGLSILSASHHDILRGTLDAKGLHDRFEHVVGLSHNRASSKLDEAMQLMRTLALRPDRTLYVGDTTHDYDVAYAVGWRPALVSTGHHDASRLLRSGAPVYGGLGELLKHLTCRWSTDSNDRSVEHD